jgi:hypothetical protein
MHFCCNIDGTGNQQSFSSFRRIIYLTHIKENAQTTQCVDLSIAILEFSSSLVRHHQPPLSSAISIRLCKPTNYHPPA